MLVDGDWIHAAALTALVLAAPLAERRLLGVLVVELAAQAGAAMRTPTAVELHVHLSRCSGGRRHDHRQLVVTVSCPASVWRRPGWQWVGLAPLAGRLVLRILGLRRGSI